jgi:hypothetical protein
VTKQELLDGAWPDTAVGDAVLTTVVREIRSVLGDPASQPWLIETVHRRGYRLLEPIAFEAPARGAPNPAPALPALVGRQAELDQLAAWWDTARGGERQVVFVSGEPGIGKTALVDAFVCHQASMGDALVGRGQCIEQHGAGEAYLPVLAALGELCREPGGDRGQPGSGGFEPQPPSAGTAERAEGNRSRCGGGEPGTLVVLGLVPAACAPAPPKCVPLC